jgi:ABC-2 type transport system permease protein
MALVIGMYIVFNALWGLITGMILLAVEGEFAVQNPPTWHEFLVSISPLNAFGSAARYLDIEVFPLFGGLGESAAASDPFFLQDWFGFVILLAWMVVPLLIGYYRFERADLG